MSTEWLKQQHEEQINSTREALTDKFKNEMSSLQDNVVLGAAMSLSEDSASSFIEDYLTSDGIGDMIQDRILGATLRKVLAGDEAWESAWLALFDRIDKARESLAALERKKAKKDFSDQLQSLHQEFWLSGVTSTVDVIPTSVSDEVSEAVDISEKNQILFSDIESSPFEKWQTATLCSATAQKNAKDIFGIVIPSWNAKDAEDLDMTTATQDSNKRYISLETKNAYIESIIWKDAFSQAPSAASVADVFVKSTSKYGHRCFAFKKFPQNEWYILDPYRAPDSKSNKPKKLSDYAKKNTITKVNFYETDTVVVDSIQQPDQFA